MKRIVLVFAIIYSLITGPVAIAAVKAGSTCTKKGLTATVSGKKFTCIKSGKKLVWNKGVQLNKTQTKVETNSVQASEPLFPKELDGCQDTSERKLGYNLAHELVYLYCGSDLKLHYGVQKVDEPNSGQETNKPANELNTFNYPWVNVCERDPWVPPQWIDYQEFALKTFGCARPYRYVDIAKSTIKPTSAITNSSSRLDISKCKIPWQEGNENGFKISGWKFYGNISIQVIPLEFNDYKSNQSPLEDYQKYLDYIKDMFYKVSDGNLSISYKIPAKYISVGKSLDSYSLGGDFKYLQFTWKNVDVNKYSKEIFEAADKEIDFTNTDLTFVLVPPSVPAVYIPHSSDYRIDNKVTNEGLVKFNYLMPSTTPVDFMSWFGSEPFLHIHEVMHANGLLGDHYGDDMGRSGPDVGAGAWGAMSGMQTDFLIWDKWISGMNTDSQVICVSPENTSINLLNPVEIFGNLEKMIVIPISNTKAIAIESHRQGGVNYKLTSESLGALVYLVDTSTRKHGSGINVLRLVSRTQDIYKTAFILSDAPLKLGEYIETNGFKISVIESGDFGDVIKVEKAS